MIFNEEVFFDNKPIKIIIKLMTALNKVVDLIEVQSTSDFEDIQFGKDEKLLADVLKDFMDIDGPEDDIEDDGLSNKPLDESFYPILPLSVHDYLDYTDFFIFIRFERVGKRAMAVITAIPITARTPLVVTAEIAATPGTRSDQIGLSKGVGSISNLKVRFYNDVIVIKESDDIDITALNDKAAILGATTLEISQPVSHILKYERITYL